MKLKYIAIALLAAAFAAVVVLVPEERKTVAPGLDKALAKALVGSEAPDIELIAPGGGPWRLSEQRGSVVLINFWATWCPSCKEEMPDLQKLYDLNKANPDFKLVTVLYNDSAQNASAYLKENNFTLPVLTDPGGAAYSSYGLTGVPETFIVDKKGVLREKIIGPAEFGSPEAAKYFSELLGE